MVAVAGTLKLDLGSGRGFERDTGRRPSISRSEMAAELPGLVGQSHLGKMKKEEIRQGLTRVVNGWSNQDSSAIASASMGLLCGALWTKSATWGLIQTVHLDRDPCTSRGL